ncbi:pilus assembly protein [Dyella solisilvae]|uniref:Pilus assembly protein n=1 Tax=Dyella solisilvae TaxID=1920168 RepID=A0A370K7B4_9GAMM|nr:pilus assembly protein [Dyella solisilvae]RDI98535.1 pilus assembly protein [Dyella solisilvae]
MGRQGIDKAQRGQGMTEYIIIVALIAIAAIAAFTYYGNIARLHTDAMASELAGKKSDNIQVANKFNVDAAAQEATQPKDLSDYKNVTAQ